MSNVTKEVLLSHASEIQTLSRRVVKLARKFPTFIFITVITQNGDVKYHVYGSKRELQNDRSIYCEDVMILDIFNYSALSGEVWNFNERMINNDFAHYLSVCMTDRF